MADKFPYTLEEPATLLFSSITQKTAPRGVQGAEPKYSGTFGLGKVDFDKLIPVMVQAIQSETGAFSGNPNDYYLACMSGKMAAQRVRQKAQLDAQAAAGRGNNDEAFKIQEKAEKRASVYETFAGILTAASKFEVELARLDAGKIIDIKGEHNIAQAGKDLFFPGAIVVPRVAIQGFRRKTLDAKDGCTGFLQNCLFIRKGPKLDLGGGGPNNQEVFGGFQNYSDYDPLANAPGGDSSGWSGGTAQQGNGAASQSQGAGSNAGDNSQQNNGGQQNNWNPNPDQGQNNGYQPQGGQAQQPDPTPQW